MLGTCVPPTLLKKAQILIVLLCCLVAAVYLVVGRMTAGGPQSDEEIPNVVRSVVNSLASANRRSTGVQVAFFCLDRGRSSAHEPLEDILTSDIMYRCDRVDPTDIQKGLLDQFDVVIFPGGSGSQQAKALGKSGKQEVRRFVEAGGGYVGICAGAFLATAGYDWSLGLLDATTLTGQSGVRGHGDISMASRGGGTVKIELTTAGRRVFGAVQGLLDAPYSSGPIFSRAMRRNLSSYVTLARFRSEIWQYEPQKGTMIDTPAIIAGRFGKGHVIAFSIHPESSKGLEPLVKQAITSVARALGETK